MKKRRLHHIEFEIYKHLVALRAFSEAGGSAWRTVGKMNIGQVVAEYRLVRAKKSNHPASIRNQIVHIVRQSVTFARRKNTSQVESRRLTKIGVEDN